MRRSLRILPRAKAPGARPPGKPTLLRCAFERAVRDWGQRVDVGRDVTGVSIGHLAVVVGRGRMAVA